MKGVRVCWRPSPLPSRRVLDRSTGVNWILADEITAELSIVEALQQPNSYYSLGTFPFPSEPFHFLSLVRNEHPHQHVSAPPPGSDAIMLLFSHHCWERVPQKLSCMHLSSLAQSSLDPGHHTVVCLLTEAVLHCTDPLWCQEWTSRLVWVLLSPGSLGD